MGENDGLVIPMAMCWLGSLVIIKQRLRNGAIAPSSVTFAVRGDDMARRILKDGNRLMATTTGERSSWRHSQMLCAGCAAGGAT